MALTLHVRIAATGEFVTCDAGGNWTLGRLREAVLSEAGFRDDDVQVVDGEGREVEGTVLVKNSTLCEGDLLEIRIKEEYLVIDVGVMDGIGDFKVPEGVTKLRLTSSEDAVGVALPSSFLAGSMLTHVDLSNIHGVEAFGQSFLSTCPHLVEVHLPTSMPNLHTIGTAFLSGCTALKSVDLTPLSPATSINSCFLYNCNGLTEIILPPFPNLRRLGDLFLASCGSLKSIDIATLSNVHDFGNYFLYKCTGLETITGPLAPRACKKLLKKSIDGFLREALYRHLDESGAGT
eukprot:TRINITY_DN26355_c0_g1_i1.p1 TRINITY_DN26355_c0_g1~~TRINITY_DN26355_c0_g1_i1.p1  ORF type:complete len:291 (+),score=20.93 TRINITY_DN26355_c0_g1_i1:41-913(+)